MNAPVTTAVRAATVEEAPPRDPLTVNSIAMTSGFDRLARAYRWMEIFTFGPMLMRCRLAMLPQMRHCRSALVLGDGDGRFCAALMRTNAAIHVTAVDSSPAMLAELRRRVAKEGGAERLRTFVADANALLPEGRYDLVATHFFLDCLRTDQVATIAGRLRPMLVPGAKWIVSEFTIPSRGLGSIVAAALVRSLYLAFRCLTGLRVQRLPDHQSALARHGFQCLQRRPSLGGLLVAECWCTLPEEVEKEVECADAGNKESTQTAPHRTMRSNERLH